MADGIDFDIDTSAFSATLVKLADDAVGAQQASGLDVGFEIMRLSQMEVPHDKGTLQNSGTVEVIDGAIVVGYHTPYAARLHEHPEYKFKKGRKGKYLSDPIVRNLAVLGLRYANKFEKGIENK